MLGALAGIGQMIVAGATGVAVAVLLAVKPRIERLSRAMTDEELFAVLQLAVISAIVLPLLPDRGYGPWQVWNPVKIWMVVVLVSAVSFAGFVAVRWKGKRPACTGRRGWARWCPAPPPPWPWPSVRARPSSRRIGWRPPRCWRRW